MIFECATVLDVQARRLTLRSLRGSACERCMRGQGCGGGIIGKLAFRRTETVIVLPVEDEHGYQAGQVVEISLEPATLLRLSAFIYLLPLVAVLVGALAGGFVAGGDKGAMLGNGLAGTSLPLCDRGR